MGVEVLVGVEVFVGVREGGGVKVFVTVGVIVAKGPVGCMNSEATNSAKTRIKPLINKGEPPDLPDRGGAMRPVFNATKLRSPLNRRASMPKLMRRAFRLSAAVLI